MTGFIYKTIPGLKEFEDRVEQLLGAYKSIKGIGDYLDNNSNAIVEKMRRIAGEALSDIWDDMKSKVRISPSILEPLNKAYASSKGGGNGKGQYAAKPSAQKPTYQPTKPTVTPTTKTAAASTQQAPQTSTAPPAVTPNAQNKSSALDDLVNDFKNKLKSFNGGYDAKIDVYDNGSVIKNYSPLVPKQKISVQAQPNSLDQRLIADQKYLDDSIKITDMYNKRCNTSWIVNEAAKRGYEGVRNRTDITDRVALSLDAGMSYTRGKYDNTISTKLGAKEQMINDYLAGKSYKEIKESLKSKTNGMTISDSSILRTMHKYEKESRKKVVGKRNGRGKGKNK